MRQRCTAPPTIVPSIIFFREIAVFLVAAQNIDFIAERRRRHFGSQRGHGRANFPASLRWLCAVKRGIKEQNQCQDSGKKLPQGHGNKLREFKSVSDTKNTCSLQSATE